MSEKRNREANFSDEQCLIMANLIKEYEKIIECKKTDLLTIKDKENCWNKITDLFNAKSGVRRRTCKELRVKYENIKRSLKRKNAANKIEMLRTGGETPKIIVLTPPEEIVYSMTRLAVDGLPGRYDEMKEYDIICNIDEAEVLYENNDELVDITRDKETTPDNNWSKWTPVSLRQPLTPVLQAKEVISEPMKNTETAINNNKEQENRKFFKSKTVKRYPQLPESSSTNALIEAKLELIKLQCAHYNKLLEEIDQKKTKRELKIQILKVELEMKSLELKKKKEANNII